MGPTAIGVEPFHRGAEADLFLSRISPWQTVIKQRVAKKYRDPQLDDRLRRSRTLSEALNMHEARVAGVRVPSILDVDLQNSTIVMTLVIGKAVRDCLDTMKQSDAKKLFRQLGDQVARLHSAGIVHGDLTTSNIIAVSSGPPFILDFGMSTRASAPEDRGIDLHLLQRSVNATHRHNSSALIKSFAEGYTEYAGAKISSATMQKAREISRRGRYFAIR
jgi:TP53 regulating kinase and related kinases